MFKKINHLLLYLLIIGFSGLEGGVTISTSAQKHIYERHGFNPGSSQKTSQFIRSMDQKKLNAIVSKTVKFGETKNSTHGQGRKIHQYKFNKPIGKTTDGKKAYSLRVVTTSKGNVVTAFPVR